MLNGFPSDKEIRRLPVASWLRSKSVACALAVIVVFGIDFGLMPSAAADPIDDYIRAQIKSRHMPGVSIAVVRNGKLVKAAGYGYANVETGTKATAQKPIRDCIEELPTK